MITSTTIEFGKHPSKKVRTELLENEQRKEQACSGLMENFSKLWGDNPPLTETNDWIDIKKEMKTSTPRREGEKVLELLKTRHVLNTMFILEYILADQNFEGNFDEQLKNDRNPWLTTM